MKIYLAGAIEKSKDGGRYIRKGIKDILSPIKGIQLIDPCDFAENKMKTLGEVVGVRRDWKKVVRHIIEKDLNEVVGSDLIVAIVNKIARGGTITEVVTAYMNNIPIIGYFTKDVFKNRNGLHPWLLASLSYECCGAEELKKTVEKLME